MSPYYAKRALEILREQGPVKLCERSVRFFSRDLPKDPLRLFDPQYHRRFYFNTWKNHLQNCVRYDAPPDPYKTIEIRPSEINLRVGRKTVDGTMGPLRLVRSGGIARTRGGKWDRPPYRINVEHQANKNIKKIVERFEQGKNWKDTEYYKKEIEKCRISNEHHHKGFETPEAYLEKKCHYYDRLFQSIKNKGYKINETNPSPITSSHQPVKDKLEVLVTIDRKGRVNFWEGQHRFAIARVLDIKIPAQIVCRHKQWQELRDKIYTNGIRGEHEHLVNHPDIQDLL